MNPLLLLALVLLFGFLGLYVFINVHPKTLARTVRTFGATFAALAGTGLLMTGRFGLALITFVAAVTALRVLRGGAGSGGRFGSDTSAGPSGRISEITTDTLAMELDHRTGDLDGEVLQGRFSGRALGTLGLEDLLSLLVDCQRDDPRSVPLLETYLDRRHPDWRNHTDSWDDPDGSGYDRRPSGAAGGMDIATACQVLDVAPDADAEEIKAAHRRLMNRLHPDHGGSSYLAAQLNEAKDVLLDR